MMSYPFVFASLFLQLSSLFCYGQFYFKHYQTQQGLPHNAVRSIMQDSRGFIWVGTRGGLSRFDGYNFKVCGNKNDKFNNIGNNVINTLAEDRNGIIYVGTAKGIYQYNTADETITSTVLAPEKYIEHLLLGPDNTIWFIANSSLCRYYPQDKKIKEYHISVSCIRLDHEMNLWAGNRNGEICKFNYQGKLLTKITVIDQRIPQNLRSISALQAIDSSSILIGCFGRGLKRYDINSGKITSVQLNHDHMDLFVRDICQGTNQEYWIATESGVYIYDLKTTRISHLYKKTQDPYAISDNAVYKVCRDKDGGIWLATFFGGLNYCSKENGRFRKYYPIAGQNSISGSAVREIVPDGKGNLWIGTEDAGINKFNIKTQSFTPYNDHGKSASISYPNIHGLLIQDNHLLIGPFHRGLEIMNLRNGLIHQRYKSIGKASEATNDFVLSIFRTRDSTILVGTAYDEKSGLFTYIPHKKSFDRIHYIAPNTYVLTIREDKQGYIWLGTMSDGVFFYHPKTGHHGNIRFGEEIPQQSRNEFPVCGIMEDSDGRLWFTTEGGGLIRLDTDRKSITRYNTSMGFPTNVYFSMLEDNNKNLWISSLKGLICLHMKSGTFKNFTQANGLSTDQFNFNSAYKDHDGTMYFGSVNGMIAFDPKDLSKTNIRPTVFITGLEIDNKEILSGVAGSPLKKSILYLDTLRLTHRQNNFSIEFAALNYAAPEVIRYEYVLIGLDNKRTFLHKNRKAYFTGMQPGTYIFKIKAKSNVGSWSSLERQLVIIIKPPFWKTYIAYTIYITILISILLMLVTYYHSRLARKNADKLKLFEHKKEIEIYESKIEFFTNITHEIQTPLTLILGPVQRMIKKMTDQDGIKKNLLMVEKHTLRLTQLTQQLLDFRKTELHQFGLNFVHTNITHLLHELHRSFKPSAEEKNIKLSFEFPPEDITAFVDPEAMTKIASNLLSNAIKYGNTWVIIRLSNGTKESNLFIVQIANDGKPIPEKFQQMIFEPFFRINTKNSTSGTGIGLSLAKSLSELHNGSLQLAQNDPTGIVFELHLPMRQHIEFKLNNWKKIK